MSELYLQPHLCSRKDRGPETIIYGNKVIHRMKNAGSLFCRGHPVSETKTKLPMIPTGVRFEPMDERLSSSNVAQRP